MPARAKEVLDSWDREGILFKQKERRRISLHASGGKYGKREIKGGLNKKSNIQKLKMDCLGLYFGVNKNV